MIERLVPGHRFATLGSDLLAGAITAVVLVPQAMAYAMLAGLPPQIGLYACLAPLVLYGIFGGSTSLSVGPVALVSLLVLSGVGQLAQPGSAEYIALCGAVALLAGLIKILMGAFRLGFLTNFISHPVLVGFTNAAALVIVLSQFKHIFGIGVSQGANPIDWMADTLLALPSANLTATILGLSAIAILGSASVFLAPHGKMTRLGGTIATWLTRLTPLIVVVLGALSVAWFNLDKNAEVKIVGEIPRGLPRLSFPSFNWREFKGMVPVAAAVALIGYIQSISVAQTLASRKRQRIDPNRELLALGLADVGAALTQGYPVTGSFSGSAVRDAAGSQTPMASIATAVTIAVAVIWLTPLLGFIPQAVLGAVVIVSVVTVMDWRTPFRLWRYSRNDAFALWCTFLAVIVVGIEWGIAIGVVTTFASWLWRTSRPNIVEVGRIPDSEHFRNIQRHQVETMPGLLAIRLDESLYFANARYLHQYVMRQLAERQEIVAVLLIASGLNRIDATGIEVLKLLVDDLRRADVRFVLSDVKWAVSNRLQRSGFDREFLETSLYMSADQAVRALAAEDRPASRDVDTPAGS